MKQPSNTEVLEAMKKRESSPRVMKSREVSTSTNKPINMLDAALEALSKNGNVAWSVPINR